MAELSADELALYDRQLRVWGAEGQNRLKNSSILVIGLNGVGTEIVKNLVLAGVGSLEIQDDSILTDVQLSCQFFSNEEDIGLLKLHPAESRIKELNPRVNLTINTNPLNLKKLEYFKRFNLIIANNLNSIDLIELNEITRNLNITLHATLNHGLNGLIFNDLIIDVSSYSKKRMPVSRKIGPISKNREITSVKIEKNKETNEIFENFTVKSSYKKIIELKETKNLFNLTKRQKKNLSSNLLIFLSLIDLEKNNSELNFSNLKNQSDLLIKKFNLNEIDDSVYVKFLNQLNTEISPVVAILGGTLAQDVINFLSKKDLPINNVLILDGDNFTMPIYEL